MCLTEMYSGVRVGKNFSEMFSIRNGLKQGDALPPLLFSCDLEGSGRPVWLELDGTHQVLIYADDVNMLGGNMYTIKEKAEALVVASKEIGLEVNADKTKYMVMSRDQNTG